MMHVNTGSQDVAATVAGVAINVSSIPDAVRKICAAASNCDSFSVFTLNLDHVVKLKRDSCFRRAYAQARFVTADGSPIAALASRQDSRIQRTTGADLVNPLVEAAAEQDLPVYLFGTSSRVLNEVAAQFYEKTGGRLTIAGKTSPPQGFDVTGPEADAALERIADSGARLCFVALGAPKQEVLAGRAVELGHKVGFVCIGAGLDFLVGAQTRAPQWMRNSGLEWFWRLSTNPVRMTDRYTRCAVALGSLVVWEPIKRLYLRGRAQG